MKLRAKFLLLLVFVVGALTCSTLLVVRHTFQVLVQSGLNRDLRSSAQTFAKFQHDREHTLSRVAEFTAADPTLRSAMASKDLKKLQEVSPGLISLTRSCLLLISGPQGGILAFETADADVSQADAEIWIHSARLQGREKQWWYSSGELFQIYSEPIYSGEPSPAHLLGFLTLGYGITDSIVHRVSEISDSQVIFLYNGQPAATTVASSALSSCHGCFLADPTTHGDLYLDGEHYFFTSVPLADAPVPVTLVVLKSFEGAHRVLASVNRTLIGLGVSSIAVGYVLIFTISRHFARPLEDLLGGVRALAHRDFQYPLQVRSHGEFAELTAAFETMRSSLVTTQRQLLQSEQLATIGRTAGSLSHDLRHRLTAVLANSEFLLDENNPDRREKLYAGIRNAVVQMAEILDALLEFARSPQTKNCTFIDLQSILQEAIASIRFHPEFQNVQITLTAPEEISAWFDAKRLHRAFYNLLLNASQVVSPATGRILVTTSRIGCNVEICFTDNGPGVPENIRDSIFQPFVSEGKQSGTGLGLAIVQKCCHDHGGEVQLTDSRPGQTTFKITLPTSGSLRYSVEGRQRPSLHSAAQTKANPAETGSNPALAHPVR